MGHAMQTHTLPSAQPDLNSPDTLELLKDILADTLSLGERRASLDVDSELLGALPELDSMGVINIVAALEEQFDIDVDDEDISASTFATLGSLAAFVEAKTAS
jgi:acyl carrier protein